MRRTAVPSRVASAARSRGGPGAARGRLLVTGARPTEVLAQAVPADEVASEAGDETVLGVLVGDDAVSEPGLVGAALMLLAGSPPVTPGFEAQGELGVGAVALGEDESLNGLIRAHW